jgi:hypothetical protein
VSGLRVNCVKVPLSIDLKMACERMLEDRGEPGHLLELLNFARTMCANAQS